MDIHAIPQGPHFTCVVWFYRGPHSLLVIRVADDNHSEQQFWLFFAGVAYFEGVLSWAGFQFREVAQSDNPSTLRLLRDNAHPAQKRHLYEIETVANGIVRIIASDLTSSREQHVLGGFFA